MSSSRFVIRKRDTQLVLMTGSRIPERFEHITTPGALPVLYLFRTDAHSRRKKLDNPRMYEVIPVSITIEEGETL